MKPLNQSDVGYEVSTLAGDIGRAMGMPDASPYDADGLIYMMEILLDRRAPTADPVTRGLVQLLLESYAELRPVLGDEPMSGLGPSRKRARADVAAELVDRADSICWTLRKPH